MSDHPHRDDELVSAYLDNEATTADAAAVEQDHALRARAETLSAVRDAVAAPVPPPPAEIRDQIIGAAMAAANEHADGPQGVVVPLRRARPALLAVAAAVIVVAAVAGAGLLGSRLGDEEHADVASESPTSAGSGGSGDSVAMPAEADAAATDDSGEDAGSDPLEAMEIAAEEPMADEDMADEEAPAASTTIAATATAPPAAERDEGEPEPAESADGSDEPTARAVDLGVLEDIDSFFDVLAARLPESDGADDTRAPSGACSAAVNDYIEGRRDEPLKAFVAILDAPVPAVVDAVLALRGDDGTTIIVYALDPDCAPEVHSLRGFTTP